MLFKIYFITNQNICTSSRSVTIPDSVSKSVIFLVKGPPIDDFFSNMMDEMDISVLPKNSVNKK